MDATDSSLQGNKTGSIRHWWGQSVRSAGGVGTGSGSDAMRDDGVRVDGVRSGRSVEHEARPPECGVRNAVSGRPSREPTGRPAPSSSRCAFCTRGVHFALENDGWNWAVSGCGCTVDDGVQYLGGGLSVQDFSWAAVELVLDGSDLGVGGAQGPSPRPVLPIPGAAAALFIQICHKCPDRAGAPEGYSGGGFEGVGRESCGGGLLGRVLLVRRVIAEASECVSPLRLDGASRMVGRRLACRDAAGSRDRHLTREIVT